MKTIEIRNGRVFCGDPCMTLKESQQYGTFVNGVKNGIWNVEFRDEALLAIHSEHHDSLGEYFDWSEFVGRVGVDIGMAGFFENPDEYHEISMKKMAEATSPCFEDVEVGSNYVVMPTLQGDGYFPVLVKYCEGEVVAVEIVYGAACLFCYHHMAISEEDQIIAMEVVKKRDWEAYKELFNKYPPKMFNCGVVGYLADEVFVPNGCIALNEKTFEIVDHIEFECG